eukprot:gb/GECG01016523.1/.p1 GENE.gb/GECG01016523.1/~~gb/GECG01016523.1/.p1  ORF type:complete len:1331 (+),score=182.87 gb/GECG01016523.1/:1-3993(+)
MPTSGTHYDAAKQTSEPHSYEGGRSGRTTTQVKEFHGTHEPPRTGFKAGKIYYRSATRSFYLCCASSVYCFRIDKNGWLEHLYWGPCIDSNDDMTYLQYANVDLPFDPKPSQSVTAGEVISQLAKEDIDSLRAIWFRAQIYNSGTEDEDSITAARIENAAWRLMQMDVHCPSKMKKPPRHEVSTLLESSTLPGFAGSPRKMEENVVGVTNGVSAGDVSHSEDIDFQGSRDVGKKGTEAFSSHGAAEQQDPSRTGFAKVAEAMAALAQPQLEQMVDGSETGEEPENEELPSSHPYPSVAPQAQGLKEGASKQSMPSVVESICHPCKNMSQRYARHEHVVEHKVAQDEDKEQRAPATALGHAHESGKALKRRARGGSVEEVKQLVEESTRKGFTPVGGAETVSKAHAPRRLRRAESESDLAQLKANDAAVDVSSGKHRESSKTANDSSTGKLPSEVGKPTDGATATPGQQDVPPISMESALPNLEHDDDHILMNDDAGDEVGRNMKLLEYSDQGTGDYRSPSFVVQYEDGSTISPLVYKNHFIYPGKMRMRTPLPCVRTDEELDEEEASTLIVTLLDEFTGMEIELVYTVFRDYDALTRKSIVHNKSFLKGPFKAEQDTSSSEKSDDPQTSANWSAELAGGLGCQSEYERWEERATACGCRDSAPVQYSINAPDQYHQSQIPAEEMEGVSTRNGQTIKVSRLMSCSVDFHAGEYYISHLSGAWAGERQICTRRCDQGVFFVESRRGTSSHQHNPFLALTDGPPSENSGRAYGFALIYSGNFRGEVEISESRRARLNMGLQPTSFQWDLAPGESFESPEVVMTYSSSGLSQISQNFHALFREKVIPREFRWHICPVLLNTWEAMYFDVTHDKVVKLAQRAANIGVEMLVVDDGWFLGRNDDTSSLGDWFEDTSKLPFGLRGLGAELRRLGLKFGIWIEPEMVNVKSRLYRRHPHWCLQVAGRGRSEGRNQLVLDFCRPEVVEHIKKTLLRVISDAQADYIKWDMNRHLSEAFSAALPPEKQGEVFHRYMLGVYQVFQTLRDNFPNLLIETCSGGGGRFDAGMLYYSPQIWASDNTDALTRIKIQYGTSLAYPASSFGSHISEVPNHQTLRHTTLKTRFLVALCGTFGLEMDLAPFKESELAELEYYIQLRKELAPITTFGRFYRLWSPFKFDSAAWMFVVHAGTLRRAMAEGFTQPACGESCRITSSKPPTERLHDGHATSEEFFSRLPVVEQALVCAFSLTKDTGSTLPRLRLKGLNPDKRYRVVELCPGTLRRLSTGKIVHDPDNPVYQFGSPRPLILSGKALMNAGLPVRFEFDGDSVAFKLTALQGKQK